ncbi:hypothetical protein UlMin_008896 [Ulmus minor]
MAFFTTISRASSISIATSLLLRCMSNVPKNTVYGGPKAQSPDQRKGEPITVITAYDYPSEMYLDMAVIDVCLIDDSATMVVHGYDTTLPIMLNEMLVHCCTIARGAKRLLLVGDLPFGSYESSSTHIWILKEGGMNAIKLEGEPPSRITATKAIIEAGITVMGHVGLTLQAISIVETALALQEVTYYHSFKDLFRPKYNSFEQSLDEINDKSNIRIERITRNILKKLVTREKLR